ncbi:hypothetical protein [Rhodovulum marinum]|uniref:Uncharacterized protein n=1 Tax=Rhodovulum marinum TaxID=320662 RepID=A0A4V2SQP4_9RHOB|nr:hypothetical protein [Rhodovulum marinum]TCP39796.1 hypothetical protein EV662_110103 [Rhodovulum marinum]
MAARRAIFTQSDVTKVLKAYRDAGLPVVRCEIDPRTGKIVVFSTVAPDEGGNPWDAATA